MTVKMDEAAATIMAGYWADQLRAPKDQDNGADDIVGVQSAMITKMFRKATKGPSAEEIDRFEVTLREILVKNGWCWVGVDYHPDRTLSQAITESELPCDDMMTFPWKTTTTLNQDGSITAREARGKVILREATAPQE